MNASTVKLAGDLIEAARQRLALAQSSDRVMSKEEHTGIADELLGRAQALLRDAA